jgi:hypothetical protein
MPNDTVTDADYHGDLPKLIDDGNNNNFGEWQKKSYLQLLSWDLWKYIDGPDSAPPDIPILRQTTAHQGTDQDGSNPRTYYVTGNADEFNAKSKAAKPWMAANNITLSKIGRAVPGDQFHIIDHIRYAKEAWQSLHSHYQPRNSLRSSSLKSYILRNRCAPESDVGVWLSEMQRLYSTLCDLDPGSLSQLVFILAVLDNMPQDPGWLEFLCKLKNKVRKLDESQPPLPIDSKLFISKIRDQWWLRTQNGDGPQISSHVFTTRTELDRKPPKRSRASDTPVSGAKRARLTNDKSCTNPNCARKGHTITECITFGGGNQGNYPQWWKGPWNLHISPDQRTRANNVPPASHAAYAKLSAAAHAALTTTNAPDSSADSDAQAHSLSTDDTTSFVLNTSIDNDVIVATLPILESNMARADACFYDSGANRHVFHDKTAFETYQEIVPIAVKGFGHDLSTTAVGHGSVRLQSRYGHQTFSILLTDALHIPAARSNLVSGCQLDKAGVTATIGHGLVTLLFRGTNILNGTTQNGMYNLNASIIRASPPLLSRIATSPVAAALSSAPEGFYTALLDT